MPDTKIIEQWVKALESGEYKQARNTLQRVSPYAHAEEDPGFDPANSTVGFCCLGVLCDLAVKAGIIKEEEHGDESLSNGKVIRYGGSESFLPGEVMDWAGLNEHNPIVQYEATDVDNGTKYYRSARLADLNDVDGKGFGDIAKAIRENWLADAQSGSPA
jgi:hypothetical protein